MVLFRKPHHRYARIAPSPPPPPPVGSDNDSVAPDDVVAPDDDDNSNNDKPDFIAVVPALLALGIILALFGPVFFDNNLATEKIVVESQHNTTTNTTASVTATKGYGYFTRLYFATQTFFAVGYGNLRVVDSAGRWWACAYCVLFTPAVAVASGLVLKLVLVYVSRWSSYIWIVLGVIIPILVMLFGAGYVYLFDEAFERGLLWAVTTMTTSGIQAPPRHLLVYTTGDSVDAKVVWRCLFVVVANLLLVPLYGRFAEELLVLLQSKTKHEDDVKGGNNNDDDVTKRQFDCLCPSTSQLSELLIFYKGSTSDTELKSAQEQTNWVKWRRTYAWRWLGRELGLFVLLTLFASLFIAFNGSGGDSESALPAMRSYWDALFYSTQASLNIGYGLIDATNRDASGGTLTLVAIVNVIGGILVRALRLGALREFFYTMPRLARCNCCPRLPVVPVVLVGTATVALLVYVSVIWFVLWGHMNNGTEGSELSAMALLIVSTATTSGLQAPARSLLPLNAAESLGLIFFMGTSVTLYEQFVESAIQALFKGRAHWKRGATYISIVVFAVLFVLTTVMSWWLHKTNDDEHRAAEELRRVAALLAAVSATALLFTFAQRAHKNNAVEKDTTNVFVVTLVSFLAYIGLFVTHADSLVHCSHLVRSISVSAFMVVLVALWLWTRKSNNNCDRIDGGDNAIDPETDIDNEPTATQRPQTPLSTSPSRQWSRQRTDRVSKKQSSSWSLLQL